MRILVASWFSLFGALALTKSLRAAARTARLRAAAEEGGGGHQATGGGPSTGHGSTDHATTGQASTASATGGHGSTGATSSSSSSSSGVGGAGGSAASGGGGGGGTDAAAVARVTGWIAELPYGQQNLTPSDRTDIVDAIIKSCTEFGPPGADWQTYCQAILVGAILKESSYDPSEVVTDSYATRAVTGGTAKDPTVGLLQIRFSSTVNDYNTYGPLSSMAAIGCQFPDFGHASESGDSDFWAITGPTNNLAFMQSIPCNIGLAAWYYFINATGNGGARGRLCVSVLSLSGRGG